jgi:hypothetical protein
MMYIRRVVFVCGKNTTSTKVKVNYQAFSIVEAQRPHAPPHPQCQQSGQQDLRENGQRFFFFF